MKKQCDLLRETDWDVLIVLDACRADSFRRRVPRAETVRSMAWCTHRWMHEFVRAVEGHTVTYVSANPVCDRELRKHPDVPIRRVPVWDFAWTRVGPLALPTVHPGSVRAALLADLVRLAVFKDAEGAGVPPKRNSKRAAAAARLVVHYVQPHLPYVGEHSLSFTDWGNCGGELSALLKRGPTPQEALAQGLVTWEELRRAYESNLDFVLPYALELANDLNCAPCCARPRTAPEREARGAPAASGASLRVVITADHGQLLGEGGEYGHVVGPRPLLFEVPWLVLSERTGGERERSEGSRATVQDKLEALGYA